MLDGSTHKFPPRIQLLYFIYIIGYFINANKIRRKLYS